MTKQTTTTTWTLSIELEKINSPRELANVLYDLASQFNSLDSLSEATSGWAHSDGTNVGHFQTERS